MWSLAHHQRRHLEGAPVEAGEVLAVLRHVLAVLRHICGLRVRRRRAGLARHVADDVVAVVMG